MERKPFLLSIIFAILLLVGIGSTATAQTSTDPVLTVYFVSINFQPSGPFETAGLRQLIINGQLTRDTLVWREGMANWVAAGTVTELTPLLSAVPPPLPGVPPPLPSSQQTASQRVEGEPWGEHPVLAGLVNTIFGIWSFTNDDSQGGFRTAGLQIGGIALSMIGNSLYRTWYWEGRGGAARAINLVGWGLTVGGSIYGFYRGYTQYEIKMAAARRYSRSVNDNPLNNISLTAFPVLDGRGFAGAITYNVSF